MIYSFIFITLLLSTQVLQYRWFNFEKKKKTIYIYYHDVCTHKCKFLCKSLWNWILIFVIFLCLYAITNMLHLSLLNPHTPSFHFVFFYEFYKYFIVIIIIVIILWLNTWLNLNFVCLSYVKYCFKWTRVQKAKTI